MSCSATCTGQMWWRHTKTRRQSWDVRQQSVKFQFAILIYPMQAAVSWKTESSQTVDGRRASPVCCGISQEQNGTAFGLQFTTATQGELEAQFVTPPPNCWCGGVAGSNTSVSASLRWLFYILSEDTLQLPKIRQLVLRFLLQLSLFDLSKDTAKRQPLAVVPTAAAALLRHFNALLHKIHPSLSFCLWCAYLIKVNYKRHRRHLNSLAPQRHRRVLHSIKSVCSVVQRRVVACNLPGQIKKRFS